MGDHTACSPCNFEALLALPSPGNDLLSLGLPGASPQQRAPHAAGQVQPPAGQRTPDMASLSFAISEEEMEWLVALTEGDGAASHGNAAAAAAAAEAASTSTTMTAPEAQQDAQQMHPVDQRLLHSVNSEPGPLTAAGASAAAAAAADAANNAAWAADAAAASTGQPND